MSALRFLKEENVTGSMRKPIWKRRRTRFLVSATAIAFLTILTLEGILNYWSPTADGNLVCFVCNPSSSNQAFLVNANINLTDGMNQNEAMEVASKVLFGISQQTAGPSLQLLSVNCSHDEEGIWTAEFTLGAPVYDASRTYGGSEATPHALRTCVMAINPFDRTVKYNG
jgi:hypothetical protein